MSKVCKQHIEKPALIYGQCIGCEIERYQQRIKELEKENEKLRAESKEKKVI
jgi:hypothetical protein